MTDLDWLAALLAALLLGVCCGLSLWLAGLDELLTIVEDPPKPDPSRSLTGPLDCTRGRRR